MQPEDLRRFGLIPEFIGRLPVIAAMEPLDEEALLRILTEPRNALVKQYQELLSWDGIRLEFTEGALRALAREAVRPGTGAACCAASWRPSWKKCFSTEEPVPPCS